VKCVAMYNRTPKKNSYSPRKKKRRVAKDNENASTANEGASHRLHRFLWEINEDSPAMKVSSASTSIPGPPSFRKKEPVCMASLIRWSINQAVF
jgi:hypothetical protein